MDSTAIKQIGQMAVDASTLPDWVKPHVAIIGGQLVDLEEYADKRRSFRLGYNTTSAEDFAAYHDAHGAGTVYVNPDKMSARAIFDLGDTANPGHGSHHAILTLRKTPEWDAISGRQDWQSQQDAVLFLQDWVPFFGAGIDEAGAVMGLSETIASIRRIKVAKSGEQTSEVKNFGGTRSSLENVDVATRMVDKIGFNVEPYVGLPEIYVEMQVQLALSDGRPPQVKFRLLQAAAWNDRIAKSFVDELSKLVTGNRVLTGTLAF